MCSIACNTAVVSGRALLHALARIHHLLKAGPQIPLDTRYNGLTTPLRLVGYMVQQEDPPMGRFMLAARPVQMSEHADGQADDLPPATVLAQLDPEQQSWAVPHVRGLVSVSGMLHVGRHEHDDGRVSCVRMQLGPDPTPAMDAGTLTGYLHRPQRLN